MSLHKLAAMVLLPTLLTALAPMLFGQEKQAEAGVYMDVTRLSTTSTNYYGLGGQVAIFATPYIGLEGEFGHDFEQTSTSSGNGTNLGFTRSGLRITDGLFGFRVQNQGPLRFFGTIRRGL